VDQTPSGEVSWVECVSIVVQCNAMCSRVPGLVLEERGNKWIGK
jgi:hypothetical protein